MWQRGFDSRRGYNQVNIMENFGNKLSSPQEKMDEQEKFIVPESEISEQSSRSSGKGGQNVNKRSTKSEARWNVDSSAKFSDEEKERIKLALGNKITKEGDLIVVSQEERSWSQNKERAIERLNDLVEWALQTEKDRIPTKPNKASKERRLKEKNIQSEKKKWRFKKPEINDY